MIEDTIADLAAAVTTTTTTYEFSMLTQVNCMPLLDCELTLGQPKYDCNRLCELNHNFFVLFTYIAFCYLWLFRALRSLHVYVRY
jgi:hypothetical protein